MAFECFEKFLIQKSLPGAKKVCPILLSQMPSLILSDFFFSSSFKSIHAVSILLINITFKLSRIGMEERLGVHISLGFSFLRL